MNGFSCQLHRGDGGTPAAATAAIGATALTVTPEGGAPVEIDYEQIRDLRLPNYRLLIQGKRADYELRQLGYQTEDFFETLWAAYAARATAALLIEASPVMATEGDYAYTENGVERHGKAKLALYPDSLCLLPHDIGARRVPLCFVTALRCEPFAIELTLDTGDVYRAARLGHDTDPLFERLQTGQAAVAKAWAERHALLRQNLPARLGDRKPCYDAFASLDGRLIEGLFAPDDAACWFALLQPGRAAVELVLGESAATYLYRYDMADEAFEKCLRHAMEFVRRRRELIYLEDEQLPEKPLYQMAIDRSVHVDFLRRHNVKRLIHNAQWENQLRDFFQA